MFSESTVTLKIIHAEGSIQSINFHMLSRLTDNYTIKLGKDANQIIRLRKVAVHKRKDKLNE